VQVVPAGSEVVQAPRLPFDFMPKELLEVGGTTQEHLYTQLQRKATSIIGQPEGILRWRAGPPEHRLKDVASTLIGADYLITEGYKQIAAMPAGIRRLLLQRKIRKLESGYDLIAGTDLGKKSLEIAPRVRCWGGRVTVCHRSAPTSQPIARPCKSGICRDRRGYGDNVGRIPDHSPGIEPVDITCSIAPGITGGYHR